MPLYEYECKQCHQRLEKIQSFSAPPEKICPKCGGELERVISAPAIQFKGSGWYVNDYAKSAGKSATANGSEKNTSENKSESKSDGDNATKSSGDSTPANATGASATAGNTGTSNAGATVNPSINTTKSGSTGSSTDS